MKHPCILALSILALAAPLAGLRAEPAAPAAEAAASASPKDELAQLETRLKEVSKQVDAHAEVAPLKAAVDQAEKKLRLANKEASARLDPEGKVDALRKEAKTASPERQAEIKAQLKEHEKAVAADSAVAPIVAERDAAKKAYNEKRKAIAPTVAPDLPALETRRNELKKQLK